VITRIRIQFAYFYNPIKMHFRTILTNLVIASVATLVALIILEFGVRIFSPVPAATRTPIEFLNSNRIGFKAHQEWTIKEPEFEERVSINALGFRDSPVKTGTPTLVFLGDSQTYGTGLNFGERVSDRVRARFTGACPNDSSQITNIAMPGASTVDELRYIEFAVQNGVDVRGIILGVVTNDHAANVRLIDLVRTNQPLPPRRTKAASWGDALRRGMYQSRLIQLLVQRLSTTPWFITLYGSLKLNVGLGEFEALRAMYTDENEALRQIRITGEVIQRLNQIAPVIIVLIPDKYRYLTPVQQTAYRELSAQSSTVDFDREARLVSTIANEQKISLIDPIATFRDAPNPEQLSYPINGHLTPEGAALLADSIWNTLPQFARCQLFETRE
jgi:hypothetical protein